MSEIRRERILIAGEEFTAHLEHFDQNDLPVLRQIFQSFLQSRTLIKSFPDSDNNHRGPNIPETLTEGAFALFHQCPRIHSLSGTKKSDNYGPVAHQRIQVKAMSSPAPTTFGPKSVFDRLVFLDFFRGGRLDGSFDVYDIPINLIYNVQVNQTQTMRDQQLEARRPRFFMHDEIIAPNNIPILATHNLMP